MSSASPATRVVGRSAAVLVLGRAASAGLGLGLTAVLTRALALDGYGSLSTALAVLGMLAVVHDHGAAPIAVRSIARDAARAEPVLSRLVGLRLTLALPLALLGAGALAAAGETGGPLAWAAGAFALALLGRSAEIVDVVLQVAQRMGRSVAATLAGRTGHLVLALALLAAGTDRPGPFLAAAVGGIAISVGLRVRLARPWHRLRVRLDLRTLRPFLRDCAPTAASSILMILYLHADAPIVRGLAGAREAGLYNAPYRLFLLGASLPGLVMVSAAPVLAARWAADRPAFRRGARRLLAASVAAAIPLAVLLAAAAPALLRILFGGAFGEAASTLRWLAVAAAATAPGTVATAALIARDRAGSVAGLAAVALATNVGLDVVLVPGLGARGAAIATAATEVLVAVAGAVLLFRAAPARGGRS